MDLLSRIASWLGENEATISAIAAILAIAVILFTSLRFILRRRAEPPPEKAPSAAAESTSAADSSPPDLDPLTVPGFEGRPAIAVLPFDNLSGDPDQEYFADGIAEDLITRLSHWRDFPVIARNSSFTYKGKAVDVKQVSRELGVRYVVEGSVRKASDRVRITAQLIDATTGGHVWAESYDRELRDIFELQDQITEAIVASMQPELFRSEQRLAARKEPQSLNAWDCVVRGRWHLSKFTREDNEKAQSFFEKATDIDPTSALALGYLAWTHVLAAGLWWTDSREQSIDAAASLARKSLELDEKEEIAHASLSHALAFTGQQEQAIAVIEEAVDFSPNHPQSLGHLGSILSITGRPDEAITHLTKAMRLSPKDEGISWWLANMGFAHFAKGQYEEAASWLERSCQARSDLNVTHRALAATYAQLGRMEEARMALQEDLRLNPDETVSFIRQQLPYAAPEFLEPYLDGLRKAGLPE